MITSLGEEGAGLCASRAFVCFVRVSFCHFSLPLGLVGWLRFVIVALPGLFCYLVLIIYTFIESIFWFQQTRPQMLLLFDGYIILTL